MLIVRLVTTRTTYNAIMTVHKVQAYAALDSGSENAFNHCRTYSTGSSQVAESVDTENQSRCHVVQSYSRSIVGSDIGKELNAFTNVIIDALKAPATVAVNRECNGTVSTTSRTIEGNAFHSSSIKSPWEGAMFFVDGATLTMVTRRVD